MCPQTSLGLAAFFLSFSSSVGVCTRMALSFLVVVFWERKVLFGLLLSSEPFALGLIRHLIEFHRDYWDIRFLFLRQAVFSHMQVCKLSMQLDFESEKCQQLEARACELQGLMVTLHGEHWAENPSADERAAEYQPSSAGQLMFPFLSVVSIVFLCGFQVFCSGHLSLLGSLITLVSCRAELILWLSNGSWWFIPTFETCDRTRYQHTVLCDLLS